jgi:hypothetical protein
MRRIALVAVALLAGALALPAPLVAGPSLRPITLYARAGRVKKGEEKQRCHRLTFPRREEAQIGRVQMIVKGGSHHVHLYRPYNGVEYPSRDCPFAVDFSHWQLVAATQNPLLDWQLPPGVAINLGPRQPLMIQTHFVNAGTLETRGAAKAKIVLHPMDPATVTAHAGALFAQDRTVLVPPGRSTEISRCALTGDAADGRTITVMALTGHYHFRGIDFQVYRTHADGSLGELVYQHLGYDDPAFREYPPDQPLVLQPGEGLEWWCTYQNDSDTTYEFGANTARNEHCNLFGFYYPSATPQEAIDCIHRIENGVEIDERIVAQ